MGAPRSRGLDSQDAVALKWQQILPHVRTHLAHNIWGHKVVEIRRFNDRGEPPKGRTGRNRHFQSPSSMGKKILDVFPTKSTLSFSPSHLLRHTHTHIPLHKGHSPKPTGKEYQPSMDTFSPPPPPSPLQPPRNTPRTSLGMGSQ